MLSVMNRVKQSKHVCMLALASMVWFFLCLSIGSVEWNLYPFVVAALYGVDALAYYGGGFDLWNGVCVTHEEG